jgi:hypothetical protein
MSTLFVDSIEPKTTGGTLSFSQTVNLNGNPYFHVTKNADQTIPDAVDTLITFEEIVDGANGGRTLNKDGLFSNNRFTVTSTTTGIYFFYASLFFQASDTLSLHGYFRKNGSDRQQIVYANGGFGNQNKWGSYFNNQIINLSNAGDYVDLILNGDVANSGTTNINHNAASSFQRTNMGGYKVA